MTQIVTDEELFALAQNVWVSVLDTELELASENDGKIGDRAVTSCVQITGDWEGAVTIACSPTVAAQLAGKMFALDADELSDEEIRDAMGEIANMTGGNVKGIAPGENTLALPTVTEGDQGSLSIAKTRVLNRVVGSCLGQSVVITVVGRQE